jgi:secreted trypsin-like serine protease
MRRLIIGPLVAFLLVALVAPLNAITGDWVKDFEHPFVGLAVFYDKDGEFLWRCSGTLLSPTVFLTAGHCADTAGGAVSARVYFQQDAGAHFDPVTELDPVTGYPETCAAGTLGVTCATSVQIFNFDFTGALTLPNTHDVGLLILDQAISLPEYGQLAPVGTLNSLATSRGTRQTVFTVSGYGLTFKPNPNAPLATISLRERLMAEETLVNLRSALNDGFNLQTQGNGNGQGGTCNGDSGGPVFLGPYSSNLVVAVTSFGLNTLCRGTDFAFRVDTAAVQTWMAQVLGPTLWNPIAP